VNQKEKEYVRMNRSIKNGLTVVLAVSILIATALLASGTFTWSPATGAGAAPAGLNVDPLVLTQQTEPGMPGAPSQDLLAGLYETVLPSVVNIQVVQGVVASPGGPGLPGMPAQGQGSGWIWDDEGHIVTNNHVVQNANQITVFFYNGFWAEAELVATDPQADLAVIRVTPPENLEWRPLALADALPPVGHYALAFGSPFGLAGTMTKGIVSAVGRSFPVGGATEIGGQYSLPDVIQTDAAINPGNSGGPLVDLNGEVIGVNFAIRAEVRANAGVGFAIPASIVRLVVPALIEQGAFNYPFLGIGGASINPMVAAQEELPPGVLGVFVSRVEPDGPAAQAQVEQGDIITAIDGVEVRNFEDLISYLILETAPGTSVELEILRDGEPQTLTVTLTERPRPGLSVAARVTVGQAIDIAMSAVLADDLMADVDASSASIETRDGRQVWVVTLEGDGEMATVLVDATTGEVVSIETE
jgi:S1-C subfamily serine protease